MKISNQNTSVIPKSLNRQFITNTKTGEKELAINVLLRNLEENRQSKKSAFVLILTI